jgi:hypothetical protein
MMAKITRRWACTRARKPDIISRTGPRAASGRSAKRRWSGRFTQLGCLGINARNQYIPRTRARAIVGMRNQDQKEGSLQASGLPSKPKWVGIRSGNRGQAHTENHTMATMSPTFTLSKKRFTGGLASPILRG